MELLRDAVKALDPPPGCVLVDHYEIPDLGIPQEPITRGDDLSVSIAAASIVAKVELDRIMARHADEFPGYGFDQAREAAAAPGRAVMDRAYGGVVIDADGRILLREPAGHHDGYVWTFPKGRPRPRESRPETALREVTEETGVLAEITEEIPGAFAGGTTVNVYFLMRPTGEPRRPDDETASGSLGDAQGGTRSHLDVHQRGWSEARSPGSRGDTRPPASARTPILSAALIGSGSNRSTGCAETDFVDPGPSWARRPSRHAHEPAGSEPATGGISELPWYGTPGHYPEDPMGYPRVSEPLAPHALREILDAPAPKWARRRGFQQLADLDGRVWTSFSPEGCRRLANLVVERVRKRIGSAPRRLLARTPGEIAPHLRPADLSLDTRTLNALQRSRLAGRPAVLAGTPISLLMSLPGMGAKCLVDLLAGWEHARSSPIAEVAPISEPAAAPPRPRVKRAARSDAHPIEIDEPLLDRALERWLEIAGPASERARTGLAARLGWTGDPPATLEKAGQIAGVTRERIRQIQKRFEESAPGRFRIASVERAVEAIRAAVPIRAERATELLVEEGIVSRSVHPEGLLRAARLLGLDPGFEIARLEPIGDVCAPEGAHVDAGLLRQVLSNIKRHARPFGFIDRGAVAGILDEALGEATGEIADLLLALDRAQDLGDGWFYLETDHRQPAVRLIEDMLSVAGGSLTASELRRGLERRLRWRKAGGHRHAEGLVPPAQAILSFCRGRVRSFQVRGTRVTAIHPVDWRRRIAPTQRTLVETILDAPGHVLPRDEFEAGAVARGVNANTFSVMTSYSPFIKELGGGLWTVRGIEPDPVEVERVRRSRKTRGKHVEGWEWRPDGALRISIRLRRVTSLVVGIPAAIRPYLAGRAFRVLLRDGSRVGSVRVDEGGASWGYGPALSRLGPAPGDLLLADFDLTSGTVRLRVVPGEHAADAGKVADG